MIRHEILGELAQTAHLTMDTGDFCWASRGALMAYDEKISWALKVPGGLGGAVRRSFSGEGATLNYVTAQADNQEFYLGAEHAGKIAVWDLSKGSIYTTRGSFLAVFGADVNITVVVARRAGAAMFGGAGLFLQKISGKGTVLIYGSGDFIDRQLAAGETMLVSTGNLAAFAETVDYNIQGVSGCSRIFFGGEGLFMTKLSGPGRILLQSLNNEG